MMSTNFYWIIADDENAILALPTGERIEGYAIGDDDPRVHIGKRSAAGLYCWDCGVTLCKLGEQAIHGHTERTDWYDRCPRCDRTPAREDGLRTGPLAVELGFAEPRDARPTGVRGTSSFTWAQDPVSVRRACEARIDDVIVVDEYNRKLTGGAFLAMLRANCAVELLSMVGESFS